MTHIHTITYDQAKKWYDWTGTFNRLVNYVREDLRNEQNAVEYKVMADA